MPNSHSIKDVPHLHYTGDLSKLKFVNTNNIYIISSDNNIVDYYAIKLKNKNPDINVVIMNNQSHGITPIIHEKFGLDVLVQKLFFENDKLILEKIGHKKLISYPEALQIKKFTEKRSINKEIDLKYKSTLQEISNKYEEWAVIQYCMYSIFLYEKNEFEQEKYLIRSINSMKKFHQARLDLARLYFKKDQFKEVLDNLIVLKEEKFNFASGELLCRVLVKLEKFAEAKNVLQELNKTNLNDKQKKVLESFKDHL